MRRKMMAIACSGALAACGAGETDPERFANSGEIASIPTKDARYTDNVKSISYDPDEKTLTILGDPFDLAGTFERSPEKDVRGFAAFENEGGARRYLALVRTDTENGISSGVVGTPVKLDTQFGGTMISRASIPTLKKNMEVRHVGTYAGVRNVGQNDGADTSNSFLYRVEGRVQLDLDLFEDSPGVEGVIFDRRSMDQTVEVDGKTENVTYPDIVLRFTNEDSEGNSILEEGNFSGVAAGEGTGTYDGMIAGENAAASAGVVVIGDGEELERGAFIARTE